MGFVASSVPPPRRSHPGSLLFQVLSLVSQLIEYRQLCHPNSWRSLRRTGGGAAPKFLSIGHETNLMLFKMEFSTQLLVV